MKKIIFIFLIVVLNLLLIYPEEMNIRSTDNILSDIRREQGLKDTDKINPDKVNPQLLEKLGDTVMEKMIGNHDRYKKIDQIMGGEGSPALTAMHQIIGYNYLIKNRKSYFGMLYDYPYSKDNKFKKDFPLMWNNGYVMMSSFGSIGYIIGFIILIIIGFAIVFIIKLILKNNNCKQKNESSFDILKKRYVQKMKYPKKIMNQ